MDALIDEAARRLVAGEPSSSLRGRVRDRIGKRQSAWSFVPSLAGAAALLLVAAIAGRALLDRPAGPDKVGPTGDHLTTNSAPASASQQPEVTSIQPAPTTRRQLARRPAADVAALPEEDSPIPPIAIEPLDTVPLRAMPLREVQIAVDESSGVMPIEIAPLQIEPLLGQ